MSRLDAASRDNNLGCNLGKTTANHGCRVFIALIILHVDGFNRLSECKARRVVQNAFIGCSTRDQ
jgi:hypothetical protein